jgi:hypothetical protein
VPELHQLRLELGRHRKLTISHILEQRGERAEAIHNRRGVENWDQDEREQEELQQRASH